MPRNRILDRFVRGSLLAFPAVLLVVYSWSQAEQPPQGLRQLDLNASFVLLQSANDPADSADTPKRHFDFTGPVSCQPCHNTNDPDIDRDFVLLNESKIFVEQDKHHQAFELLEGELGKRIAANLKIEGDISDAKQCMSCHANWQSKLGYPKPPDYVYKRGVTCESCHGPASAWSQPHQLPDHLWRKKPIAEKEAMGMVDVRNPVRRAEQCLSCHIGNVEQGKVVTHEMYAAGHPPLPSIEIESFAEQMPPHWRYLQEKGDFQFRKEFIEQTEASVKHDPMNDLPRTRGVIIGGVSELLNSVRLFSEQAKQHADVWPELAVFDCSACHHDLKSPSWRQKRGYGKSPPGRPHMTAWPTALVRLGIAHRAGSDQAKLEQETAELEARLNALRGTLDKQPFGHPESIHAAGTAIVAWLEQLNEDLMSMPFGEDAARNALAQLSTVPKTDYPDYHSARQIAWAIKAIGTELQAPYPMFPADKEQLATWRTDVRAPAKLDVNQLFNEHMLNERLFLELPAGQKLSISEKLQSSLKTMSEYDPDWFLKQLPGLVKELKIKKEPN